MKCEFEFHFKTKDLRFDREHKYRAAIRFRRSGSEAEKEISCTVRILPSAREPPPYFDQLGSLYVLLAGTPEECLDIARLVAKTIADQITFRQGDFRVDGSAVLWERIPETSEEKAEVGDKFYGAQMNFVEVVPPPSFEPRLLENSPGGPEERPLIAQFNETKRDKSPVRQFLGYFKIIESIYHVPGQKQPMSRVLLDCSALKQLYSELNVTESYDSIVSRLVSTRHQCAHLKSSENFGYTPIDPAVTSEVLPLVPIVEALAYLSIMRNAGLANDA